MPGPPNTEPSCLPVRKGLGVTADPRARVVRRISTGPAPNVLWWPCPLCPAHMAKATVLRNCLVRPLPPESSSLAARSPGGLPACPPPAPASPHPGPRPPDQQARLATQGTGASRRVLTSWVVAAANTDSCYHGGPPVPSSAVWLLNAPPPTGQQPSVRRVLEQSPLRPEVTGNRATRRCWGSGGGVSGWGQP